MPVHELGVIVGDVVHNLRSCLDHLIEQLTIAHKRVPLDKTEFPIFVDKDLFHHKVKRGANKGNPVVGSGLYKIRGLDPAHQAIIEGFQPYHRTNDIPSHPLWLLHKLDIIDKHRVVPVVGLTVAEVSVDWKPNPGVKVTDLGPTFHRFRGVLEDKAELGQFHIDLHPNLRTGKADFQVKYDTDIVFEETGPGRSQPVGTCLHDLSASVIGVVMEFNGAFP